MNVFKSDLFAYRQCLLGDTTRNMAPQTFLLECQCCYHKTNETQQLHICDKRHIICHKCQIQLGRDTCLFCSPHVSSAHQVQLQITEPTTLASPYSNNNATSPELSGVGGWLELLIKFIYGTILIGVGLFGCIYLGKCFLYLYVSLTPEEDHDWFSWQTFHYAVGEFLIGVFGGLMLLGCSANHRR